MIALVKGLFGKLKWDRSGFTLVEMLVVVAIIVALAAVIVPTVTIFLSRGEEGAQKAELESMQTAMDSLMANKGILQLPQAQDTWTDDLTGEIVPGETLSKYFKETTSQYCYQWDVTGVVEQTQRDDNGDCPA